MPPPSSKGKAKAQGGKGKGLANQKEDHSFDEVVTEHSKKLEELRERQKVLFLQRVRKSKTERFSSRIYVAPRCSHPKMLPRIVPIPAGCEQPPPPLSFVSPRKKAWCGRGVAYGVLILSSLDVDGFLSITRHPRRCCLADIPVRGEVTFSCHFCCPILTLALFVFWSRRRKVSSGAPRRRGCSTSCSSRRSSRTSWIGTPSLV